MIDIGYPLDTIELVGNFYAKSTTSFLNAHFTTTTPNQINCGTIQGDTLNPHLFITFLEPLLRVFLGAQIG